MSQPITKRERLGDALVRQGVLTETDLRRFLALQVVQKKRLGEILVKQGVVDEKTLLEVLAGQNRIAYTDLEKEPPDPVVLTLLPAILVRKHRVIPLSFKDDVLTVAMTDQNNFRAVQEVEAATGFFAKRVRATLALGEQIDAIIAKHFPKTDPAADAITHVNYEKLKEGLEKTHGAVAGENAVSEVENLDETIAPDAAPVISLVNMIIESAVRGGASDIHLEPMPDVIAVRNRVDGALRDVTRVPTWLRRAVTARLKIMGGMDIAERRVPQDGRVRLQVEGRRVDLRVSSLPTVFGEKIVMRILDPEKSQFTLEQIGFREEDRGYMEQVLARPQGLILVTGPTGSGKSSTLYAFVRHVRDPELNIVTVENPVEYELPGVCQTQINEKVGLTFASALRAILRQDPDVVLVGEVRDQETATTVIRAALTGHLVLSTLHTNTAAAAVSRLMDLEVDPFLISSTILGVVAQRLVRTLCPHCKRREAPPAEILAAVGLAGEDAGHVWSAVGCQGCGGTGYQGRRGIYEVLRIEGRVRDAIYRKAPERELARLGAEAGMIPLEAAARLAVLEGITSCEEVLRNIQTGEASVESCPSCHNPVRNDFITCPYCEGRLRRTCDLCARPLDRGWMTCPFCVPSRDRLVGAAS